MAGLLSKVYIKVTESTKKQSAELKLLSRRDLRAVLKLFYQEGWVDFTLADLEFMFQTSPKSCFKFMCDEEMIGVTFALQLDKGILYPNSSIIAEQHRKKVKYHDEVLKYAEYLKQIANYEIMYSAKWLVEIYRDSMDYQEVCDIARKKILSVPNPTSKISTFYPLNSANIDEVKDYLETIYSSERSTFLKHVLKQGFHAIFSKDDTGITAFALYRDLPKHRHIGPIVSKDSNSLELITKGIIALASIECEAPLLLDGEPNKLSNLLDRIGVGHEDEGTLMVKMERGDTNFRENENDILAIYSHYLS